MCQKVFVLAKEFMHCSNRKCRKRIALLAAKNKGKKKNFATKIQISDVGAAHKKTEWNKNADQNQNTRLHICMEFGLNLKYRPCVLSFELPSINVSTPTASSS